MLLLRRRRCNMSSQAITAASKTIVAWRLELCSSSQQSRCREVFCSSVAAHSIIVSAGKVLCKSDPDTSATVAATAPRTSVKEP